MVHMRILVTGGTGFIGAHCAEALIARGDEVMVTGASSERLVDGARHTFFHGLGGIPLDSVGTLDALVHMAAISDPRVPHDDEMMRANLTDAQTVITEAVNRGATHIVYASSCAVYGNAPLPFKESGPFFPTTTYGRAKLALDEWAMQFSKAHPEVTLVGLRFSNVYGPHERRKGRGATMIAQFAEQMRRGNPKLFEGGEQARDYLYVQDAVSAVTLGLEASESGVYNCGAGEATSFNRLVEILNTHLGLSRVPEYIPNPYGDTYQSDTLTDMNLAREKLGFTPAYDIERGIADYMETGLL